MMVAEPICKSRINLAPHVVMVNTQLWVSFES
jgi:hypothetical protein